MSELEINIYIKKLDNISKKYKLINSESEFKDLFNGVFILFINDILVINNKFYNIIPDLQSDKFIDKISNLNILKQSLENNEKLFGYDSNDIILRAYTNNFYKKYRDILMEWNINNIKDIKETNLVSTLINTAEEENVVDSISEYLNIIPEIILIINNLKDKQIIKLLYLLNNLNTILDIYLLKKINKELN